MARKVLTADELRSKGLTVPMRIALEAAGIGETRGYQLARTGELPFPVFKVGRVYKVPTAGLLRALGIEDESKATA